MYVLSLKFTEVYELNYSALPACLSSKVNYSCHDWIIKIYAIGSKTFENSVYKSWGNFYYRGVTGYLKLNGQILNTARCRCPAVPSILPKTGWVIAHRAPPPLTPLNLRSIWSNWNYKSYAYRVVLQWRIIRCRFPDILSLTDHMVMYF